MAEYTFYWQCQYYTVLACTYEAACRSFSRTYGRAALDSALVTNAKAA